MSTPFLGEIRIFACNFAPRGWAMCNGQLLPINQNQALFSLLGTNYGGNGQTTFALPNLQGRVAIHEGQGSGLSAYTLGETGGAESVTLLTTQMPQHTHSVAASSAAATGTRPGGSVPARASTAAYATTPDGTLMNATMLTTAGGGQPHENRQPYLVLNFCIALQGIFPARN
jgi:microcystin-dependent protein